MRARLFTATAVIDPVFLNWPLAEQVQYEMHSGLHSADPTQIYRSVFGIDVDENRFGVAMSHRVSTVGSAAEPRLSLTEWFATSRKGEVRLINKCWSQIW
jgi:hypothetical protein